MPTYERLEEVQELIRRQLGSPDWNRVADPAFWVVEVDEPHEQKCANYAAFLHDHSMDQALEADRQAAFLGDIFGPLLFRPIVIDPTWLTWNDRTVHRTALSIYNNATFGDLPVLADMLEEAGCTNTDILDHCRGPGPHVKGCWVVDLLLGKS